MTRNPLSSALSSVSRYRRGFLLATVMMVVLTGVVVVLLVEGVPELAAVLSPHLVDAGMAPATAEFVAAVAIHVGFATVLLGYVTEVTRANFYGPSHEEGRYRFPMYSWVREWVQARQIGGADAEQWPETPPARSEMVTALCLGAVVLTLGLLFIGAPVVGVALAVGGHAVARRWGTRPVRPVSWHLALTTLLVPVATALLSIPLHVDGADEWIGTVGDLFLGLFTDSQIPFATVPIYAVSLVVAYLVVTYVGMYHLLVAWDSWRVRTGSLPTAEESSPPTSDA